MHSWRFNFALRPYQFPLLALVVAAGALLTWGALSQRVKIDPLRPPCDRLGDLCQTMDIQTANAAEIATLPGVGRSLANAIIQHRTALAAKGERITRPEALLAVHGIGPHTLGRMKPYLRLDEGESP